MALGRWIYLRYDEQILSPQFLGFNPFFQYPSDRFFVPVRSSRVNMSVPYFQGRVQGIF